VFLPTLDIERGGPGRAHGMLRKSKPRGEVLRTPGMVKKKRYPARAGIASIIMTAR
jgi:hypothetical protein